MADDLTVVLRLLAKNDTDAAFAAAHANLDRLGGKAGTISGVLGSAGSKTEEFARKSESMGARVGGVFQRMGAEAQSWGVPFSGVLTHVGDKMSGVEGKAATLGDKLAGVGKVATVAGVAGFAVAAGESIHLAEKFGAATGQIAAQADISVDAAKKIGDAFLATGFQTTFSAQQLAQAYAPVSGQLGAVAGHALSAKEALDVMRASVDLAEASHTDLGSATATVAKTLQTFQLPASSAAAATNDLFTAGRLTGQGVEGVSAALQRTASQLGAVKPSLQDLTAFMVDLTQHGETGRAAIGAVNAAMTTLLKSGQASPAAAKAVESARKTEEAAATRTAAAEKRLADLRAVQASKSKLTVSDHIALQNAQDAVAKATEAQAAAHQNTAAAMAANDSAAAKLGVTVYDAQGKFVGMHSIISQLEPKLKGLTQAQQLNELQTLFGAQANRKLLDTVLAGPDAFDKLAGSVSASGSAHDAAGKATDNLHGQMDKLKSGVSDLGVQFGEWLIPKLNDAVSVVSDLVGWFERNKDVAEALAGVIGGALTLAVGAFAYKTVSGAVENIKTMFGGVQTLASKIPGLGGGSTLAAEGETAATALDAAATNLQSAAAAINTAAANLAGAGGEAAAALDTAGGATAGELTAGAGEAAATLETGGAGAGVGAGAAGAGAAGEGAVAGAGAGLFTASMGTAIGVAAVAAVTYVMAQRVDKTYTKQQGAVQGAADSVTAQLSTASDKQVLAADKIAHAGDAMSRFTDWAASHLFGTPTPAKVTGAELAKRMPELVAKAAAMGVSPDTFAGKELATLRSKDAPLAGIKSVKDLMDALADPKFAPGTFDRSALEKAAENIARNADNAVEDAKKAADAAVANKSATEARIAAERANDPKQAAADQAALDHAVIVQNVYDATGTALTNIEVLVSRIIGQTANLPGTPPPSPPLPPKSGTPRGPAAFGDVGQGQASTISTDTMQKAGKILAGVRASDEPLSGIHTVQDLLIAMANTKPGTYDAGVLQRAYKQLEGLGVVDQSLVRGGAGSGGLRYMDEGGIITGPTLAGLAINSRPEVVLPLSELGRWLPGVNTTPQHAYAGSPSGAAGGGGERQVVFEAGSVSLLTVPLTADQIAREIAWTMKRQ